MACWARYLNVAFAAGLLMLAGTDALAVAPHNDPTAGIIGREAALIAQVRMISRSGVFYALIELADPEPPGPLHEQLVKIKNNHSLDPSHKSAWILQTLSVFIRNSQSAVVRANTSAEIGADAPPPGAAIAAGYAKLEDRILRHLVGLLPPEVLDAFRERFVALARIDISHFSLQDFSSESYAALGDLLDANPRDDHVRRLHSTLLSVHERLQTDFVQQLAAEMDEIEGRWKRMQISTSGKREAYRAILERVHREIARYKAVREIAFTLEIRIDLRTPHRYYLRALGRAFEFNINSGKLRDDEFISELAGVVTRHMAEWHTVSRLLFVTTLLAEGPEGMHRWMYGTIDCARPPAAGLKPTTMSKSDRYETNDCACVAYYSNAPESLAACCNAYERRRYEENWRHLEVIFQDIVFARRTGPHAVGPPRHDSVADIFAEAISSRIVTDHTDLIADVHRAVRCLLDPRGAGSCVAGARGAARHLQPFAEKLREPAEGAVLAATIGATIGAISLDPGMPGAKKLQKIDQMTDMLVLIHTDEALATLLDLFDQAGRGRTVSAYFRVAESLEAVLLTRLTEFVLLNRFLDPEQRRLTSEVLDHLLMKCREVSLSPYGTLYDFRYIRALHRLQSIQPRLSMEEDEVIERDDLINDIVTNHAVSPGLFVASVFHLSALLMDFAEHWTFWNAGEPDLGTRQAVEVFEVLSWVNSSLGRAKFAGTVSSGVLSSDDREEVRIVVRAYGYFAPQVRYGRTLLARSAPPQFYEAVLPLMRRWIHMLPRHLVDRMRDEVIQPLTAIARMENAEALLVRRGREFFTDGIEAELAILVSLIGSNHNEDRRDRALKAELQRYAERPR